MDMSLKRLSWKIGMQIINVTKMDPKILRPVPFGLPTYRAYSLCIYGTILVWHFDSCQLTILYKSLNTRRLWNKLSSATAYWTTSMCHYCKESLTIRLAAASSEIIIRQKPIITIMMLNENSMYMLIAVGQVIITRLPTGLKIRTLCFNTGWDTINIDCTFQMVRKPCYVQWGVDLPEIKFTAENDGFLNLYCLSFEIMIHYIIHTGT